MGKRSDPYGSGVISPLPCDRNVRRQLFTDQRIVILAAIRLQVGLQCAAIDASLEAGRHRCLAGIEQLRSLEQPIRSNRRVEGVAGVGYAEHAVLHRKPGGAWLDAIRLVATDHRPLASVYAVELSSGSTLRRRR